MTKVVQFSQLGGPLVLEFVDTEITPPEPDEVQIAMRAAGLNRAELLFMQGAYLVQPSLPGSRIGFEGAGEIVAIGSSVTNWKVGDRAPPRSQLRGRLCGITTHRAPQLSLVGCLRPQRRERGFTPRGSPRGERCWWFPGSR